MPKIESINPKLDEKTHTTLQEMMKNITHCMVDVNQMKVAVDFAIAMDNKISIESIHHLVAHAKNSLQKISNKLEMLRNDHD